MINRVDWNKLTVPDDAIEIHYRCTECGDELIASIRLVNNVMPALYCDCDKDVGYPYNKYRVKFSDGKTITR